MKRSFSVFLLLLGCQGGGITTSVYDQKLDVLGEEQIVEEVELKEAEELEMEMEEVGTEILETQEAEVSQGQFGWPCNGNSECLSGYCIETPEGRICSKQCSSEESCGNGFACIQVSSYPDVVFICVHESPRICRPCMIDDDCVTIFSSSKMGCVRLDGHYFCLRSCKDSDQCQSGFTCKVSDRGSKYCIPDQGICQCTEVSIKEGYKGKCERENDIGTCVGEFMCEEGGLSDCSAPFASMEVCNGKDDDCNDEVDDLIEKQDCDLTNAYGTCKGTAQCIGGQLVCQGAYAVPEICNGVDDDCDGKTDEGFGDLDGDGMSDCVDMDKDGDGIENENDNCPDDINPDQTNADGDNFGDACDPDDDNDGIVDAQDNCPTYANKDQKDIDFDGKGDICDEDIDGDNIANPFDNCPYQYNPDQEDTNSNGIGDACDSDADGDGVANKNDNCPLDYNPDQKDFDKDGMGDVCDKDDDNDGVLDDIDICPLVSNPGQEDLDNDAVGDLCDEDMDGDNIPNTEDNCIGTYNPGQEDLNNNGIGDACENDWDGDFVANSDDNCPNNYNPKQEDMDFDGKGDVCDEDADGDGIENSKDNCEFVANPEQNDMDFDGIGDGCDYDMDGDQDPNEFDCDPSNPNIHHNAKEVCDGEIDENCNDIVDEPDAKGCTIFYLDEDKDTFGQFVAKCLCKPQEPFTAMVSQDCNDKNPNINPEAKELCNNGIDDNCNSLVDEEGAKGCNIYYKDFDQDGFGTQDAKCLCSSSQGYTATKSDDCDDLDKNVFPGQIEVCNGKDDNCNSVIDEEDAMKCQNYYKDADHDGFGIFEDKKCLCSPIGEYSTLVYGDCDDDDVNVNPKASEVCDGKDNDCDNAVDETGASACVTYYLDADGDGFGVALSSKCLCAPEPPYSATNTTDCNDSNKAINPDAKEVCNFVDDNCNQVVDEPGSEGCEDYYFDNDGDGFGVATNKKCLCNPFGKWTASQSGDCNDNDKSIYPMATEQCNGKDDDCDDEIDEEGALLCKEYLKDEDGDKFGSPSDSKCLCNPVAPYTAIQGGDCNDLDKAIFPNANELCNDKDDDCDGMVDEEGAKGCKTFYFDQDGDGFGSMISKCLCDPFVPYTAPTGGDCNDNNPKIYPGAKEACNQTDDNCDGRVDEEDAEGCSLYYFDGDGDAHGKPDVSKCLCGPQAKYTSTVGDDCNDNDKTTYTGAVEMCNGKDDNCDGVVDEENSAYCKTYYLDEDGDGWGVQGQSKCLCAPAGKYTSEKTADCDDKDLAINPSANEICQNGKDDNCNKQVDEPGCEGCVVYFLDQDGDGWGVAGASLCLSSPQGDYKALKSGDCNDKNKDINPDAIEKCNQIDDNCSGIADEEGAQGCSNYYFDGDGDGHGVGNNFKCLCSPSGKYTSLSGNDCNDNDGSISPSAIESCNQKDDNCDGVVDEPNSKGCKVYYKDADKDGFGLISDSQCLCEPKEPFLATKTGDCNDQDKDVNPSAIEICNGKDDDCDLQTDEEAAQGCITYLLDMDQDSYGVTGSGKCLCQPSAPYTATKGDDCNDQNNSIHPNAIEKCNGLDDDCDGLGDEEGAEGCSFYYVDADTDGYGVGQAKCLCAPSGDYKAKQAGDCDDTKKTVYPGAPEFCNNIDDDCDTIIDEDGATGCKNWYPDMDKDGYGAKGSQAQCACSQPAGKVDNDKDCNDNDSTIKPGAFEKCFDNIDNNCDGTVDEGCILESCKALRLAHPELGSGVYKVKHPTVGEFEVYCDMTTNGGGWTLIGVVANDGTRRWDTVTVWQEDSQFGSLSALTQNFKSKAFKYVAGNDFMVITDEYSFAWNNLIQNKSFGDYVKTNWPSSCATYWIRGKPDWTENLTTNQADLISFTLRGWDNNASCFPGTNESSAISMQAAECCWVNGLGNCNNCYPAWSTHDLSLLKKIHLVGVSCNPNTWPCNPQGVTINYYSGGGHECYDASCKVVWARMFVR